MPTPPSPSWTSSTTRRCSARIAVPSPERIFELEAALRRGVDASEVVGLTGVDPWFVGQLERIVEERRRIESADSLGPAEFRRAKRLGFSDAQLAWLRGSTEGAVRAERLSHGVRPTFKTVDTCAAEFEAFTPYHYATYEEEDEVRPSDRRRVVILGSGPNRIGQGIEFDYCCVHASMSLRDAGYETVMVNCNPETVSTDYDTSDRLYFEPLTAEDVANVLEAELEAGGTRGRRRRVAGRPDAPQARPLPAARARARYQPGVHRPGGGPRTLERFVPRAWTFRSPPAARRRTSPRRSPSPARSGIRCSFARATCSAAGPWRSSTTTRACGG